MCHSSASDKSDRSLRDLSASSIPDWDVWSTPHLTERTAVNGRASFDVRMIRLVSAWQESIVRHRAATYGLTLAAVGAAGIARWLLDPWLGGNLSFLTFYFGVIFSAWYGGLKPGILASVLGLVAGDYFFADPPFTFTIDDVVQQFNSLPFSPLASASA